MKLILGITGMPASGKSLDASERVVIIDKEGFIKNERICDLESYTDKVKTFCFNQNTLKAETKEVTHLIKHKLECPLLEVKTASGRSIKVTKDHSLFTIRNGVVSTVRTSELSIGDNIPISRTLPYEKEISEIDLLEVFKDENEVYVHNVKQLVKSLKVRLGIKKNEITNGKFWLTGSSNPSIKNFIELLDEAGFDRAQLPDSIRLGVRGSSGEFSTKLKIDDNLMRFLGFFISEGRGDDDKRTIKITHTNPRAQREVQDSIKQIGFNANIRGKDVIVSSVLLSKILNKLFDVDLPSSSRTKKIPTFLYSLPRNRLKIFISAYLEGDGYANGAKGEVEATSASRDLVDGLALLFLKFNVVARIKTGFKRATNSMHKGDFYHRLTIAGRDNIQKLIDADLFCERLKNQIKNYISRPGKFHTNVDLVPAGELLKDLRENLQLNQKDLFSQYEISKYENKVRLPYRTNLQNIFSTISLLIPTHLMNNIKLTKLKNLAFSDLFWDKITEIKEVKSTSEYVYDLSVKDSENFLSFSGIFLHNSTVAEHLKEKKEITYIHMSDFIWQELERQGIKQTNINGSMYGLYMHEIYKDQPIIQWTDKKIREAKTKIILLDSIRALDHHIYLKKKYNYKLISVLTGSDERFEREAKRKRFGEAISRKLFESRDADELSRGVGSVIALADYYLDGNKPMKQVLAEAEALFSKIKRTV